MDEIKQVLADLNIFKKGEYNDDGYYVIVLDDYEDFNAIYSKLEKSLKVQRDSEHSYLQDDDAHIQYYKDNVIIELIGLLDENDYTLNLIKED